MGAADPDLSLARWWAGTTKFVSSLARRNGRGLRGRRRRGNWSRSRSCTSAPRKIRIWWRVPAGSSIGPQVQSPYVARILGAGKDRNGRLWIAFERLAGEGSTNAAPRTILCLASRAGGGRCAPGLSAAHAAGVIHRDIKPANLFVEKRVLTAKEIAEASGGAHAHPRFRHHKVRKGSQKGSEPSLTAFDATLEASLTWRRSKCAARRASTNARISRLGAWPFAR